MAKLVGCVALATWVALAPVASACSVPVFRYALERWPSDAYRVAVFHRGKLSEADQKVVDWMIQVGTPEESYPRLVVRAFDVDGELDEGVKKIWETCKDAPLPHMVVFYPAMARIPEPTWSGKLSAEAAQRLVASPARKQIAERILAGDSAVWVLLEIGDKAKDDAAAKTLATQFEKVKKELQIPEQDPPMPGPPGADDAGQAAPGVDVEVVGEQPDVALGPELRVGFSLLRVQRTDAAESLFIQMLLRTEEDLAKLKHPMAFPVYGRGRALFALVGEGINEENIFEACAFLVGPCACQIKAQAPGTDLLMLTDWDRLLEGEMVKDELPPLLGVPDAEQVAAAKAPAPKDAKPSPAAAPEAAPSNAPLYRNIAIAVAAALGLLVLATVVVLRKSKEQ